MTSSHGKSTLPKQERLVIRPHGSTLQEKQEVRRVWLSADLQQCLVENKFGDEHFIVTFYQLLT